MSLKAKDLLTKADPNTLSTLLQQFDFGRIVSSLPRLVQRAAVNLAPTDMIAAVQSIKLPDDAKCALIISAYALGGGGTVGALTIDAGAMTSAVAAGHVAYTSSGDLAFATADAWTSVDVLYIPKKLESQELVLPVVAGTGVCVVPAAYRTRIAILEEAAILSGTSTGTCAVVAHSDSAPGTTLNANLTLNKQQVMFRIADAVTSVRVKLGLVPSIDLNTLLESVVGNS